MTKILFLIYLHTNVCLLNFDIQVMYFFVHLDITYMDAFPQTSSPWIESKESGVALRDRVPVLDS